MARPAKSEIPAGRDNAKTSTVRAYLDLAEMINEMAEFLGVKVVALTDLYMANAVQAAYKQIEPKIEEWRKIKKSEKTSTKKIEKLRAEARKIVNIPE